VSAAEDVLEARKAALIAAAVEPDTSRGEMVAIDGVEAFITRYFQHVAADDMVGWSPSEVYDTACDHREFAAIRPPGVPKVRVYASPARPRHSIIEIVTDDMPFLVDSVAQELARLDAAIHLLVHPQFVVRRDLNGRLLAVLGTLDAHEAPADAMVESWMHLEVAGRRGANLDEDLRRDLFRVLRDVRDAVEDWPRMRALAARTAAELDVEPPAEVPAAETAEVVDFLRWLADDHFTFLGYREYRLVDDDGVEALAVVPGTGLGVLRSDKPTPRPLTEFPPEVRVRVHDRQLLLITKANSRATVHRPVFLDYIGVKVIDARGVVVGERRFIGLFTSAAYTQSVWQIPLLRSKSKEVLERSGFPPLSHSGKDLARILEDHPRDDMFQISVPELYDTAIGVLHLQERRRLRLFMRRDVYGRFVSCLVYLPRERHSTKVRLKMEAILLEALGGTSIDDTLRVGESVLARVHFVVRVDPHHVLDVDRDALEQRLVVATRTWEDDFADELSSRFGDDARDELAARYADAFPESYKEDFEAAVAVDDLHKLEALTGDDDFELQLYVPVDTETCDLALKLYRRGAPVSLSYLLPILQSMGVVVTDERPYEIERRDGSVLWIYDFGLRHAPVGVAAGPMTLHSRFHDALAAAWRGRAEVDGWQALVLEAGLTWQQVLVLRAYAKYLRQAGSRFSQEYLESAMRANPHVVRLLVSLFEVRLDPALDGDREVAERAIAANLAGALDAVVSLDEDRILRSFLSLIQATLRTNYWQRAIDGLGKPYLSLKLDSRLVADLPEPRPRFEIFVYSPRTEGVHLRFGPVARGGIRYSDRREDFRTEVLGLAKTQTVKNAVIVPVGSKGGFVVKRPPADIADRQAQLAEVVACYRILICGLLDLTDNLAVDAEGRHIVPPIDTVRHDGDDSYLVVAADKGTATFSDIANGISADYGFWLGDAFASGGSAGYDHKVMGITARGAWESVTRHFRELGINCQTTDFTCIGIGDMSGDVFGNGMLLSPHIRLLAAFDHRHIFVDPAPDAATSFTERGRLFGLTASSWADYDRALISAGGGVWSRTAKSVPVSPEMAAALGIPGGVTAMAPSDLMRVILKAPADLLWNGGIGTYVKAHSETQVDVGDRANDTIRVDGRELRCRVVGEGGNLGFTQLGRLEFALAGGHINTDAIDNSAGVDTSDHEVNIKILLDAAARSGDLDAADRGPLLAMMTDEVGALVLRDNYSQNLALSCSQAQAVAMLHVHAGYIDWLDKNGHLVRALEHLPDADAIAQRRAAGLGLTRPELALLLAYAKITITQDIVGSDLPDDGFAERALVEYFPTALREEFAAVMSEHPLRREIIATQLANKLVNLSGSTFVFRVAAETAASVADITRAHSVARMAFRIDDLWADIEALDDVVASDVQTGLLLDVRQFLDRATRWFLANRRPPIVVPETAAQFGTGIESVFAALPQLVRGRDAESFGSARDRLTDAGVPEQVAARAITLTQGVSALAVVDISVQTKFDVDEVARVHFALADVLGLSRLGALIAALPRDSRWHTLARTAARDDLQAAHAELTTDVLLSTAATSSPDEWVRVWQEVNSGALARATAFVDDVGAIEVADLATLSVALREIRALARAAALPRA
jgi:glutamate dehydrogenase